MSDGSSRPAATSARIHGVGVAFPPYHYSQGEIRDAVRKRVLAAHGPAVVEGHGVGGRIDRLFAATGVQARHSVVDFDRYFGEPRSTGERMAEYARCAAPLALAATEQCLAQANGGSATVGAGDITDLIVVSCTGYSAPGVDVQLARDLGMPRDVRRVVVGHMGCFGALVGLRQALAALAARPGSRVLLVCVELCSLHFSPTLDPDALTSFALFGDAAAAVLLAADASPSGHASQHVPQVVDTYCAADFEAAEQMSWTITDAGFIMGLSPRVPITLRRNVRGVVDGLLAPHDLDPRDVKHWIVHPGGPSILEVIAKKLELTEEQMAPSWQVLAEHGNCSSATVLLILARMLYEARPRRGEWGVMMAFGPGLTLETALLRF